MIRFEVRELPGNGFEVVGVVCECPDRNIAELTADVCRELEKFPQRRWCGPEMATALASDDARFGVVQGRI